MTPLTYIWDGEAMRPASAYLARRAKEQFKAGERVQLEQIFDRSPESHKHYFASVHEAWLNLPEKYKLEFPSSEALRKRALILQGFHNRQDFVCASKAEATRTASVIRSIDDYALVVIEGSVVSRLTAKSQAHNVMRKAEFQDSKTKVLAYCWGLCGIDAETGEIETGRAA